MDRKYIVTLADAVEARATGQFDTWLSLYVTDGGTLIIASNPATTDSGRPHDLAAVLPGSLGGGRVVPLRISVAPEFIKGLEDELASREAVSA